MKYLLARVMLLFGFVSFSCGTVPEKLLPSFMLTIPAIRLRIPPIPIVPPHEVPIGALSTHINMDSTIRAKTAGTFGADAVHSVHVKELVVKLGNADIRNNLSSFESARIRIYADTSFIDIATIRFPTVFADSLVVVPTNSPEISKYLKRSQLSYNLFWKNRQPTTRSLQLDLSIVLNVK